MGLCVDGHINPAVTFGSLVARKVSLIRAVMYVVAQCLGAISGAGIVKAFQKGFYERNGGGANMVSHGYSKGAGLGAEIIGTFVLVYTVFSATDPKRKAKDSNAPACTLTFWDSVHYKLKTIVFCIVKKIENVRYKLPIRKRVNIESEVIYIYIYIHIYSLFKIYIICCLYLLWNILLKCHLINNK